MRSPSHDQEIELARVEPLGWTAVNPTHALRERKLRVQERDRFTFSDSWAMDRLIVFWHHVMGGQLRGSGLPTKVVLKGMQGLLQSIVRVDAME